MSFDEPIGENNPDTTMPSMVSDTDATLDAANAAAAAFIGFQERILEITRNLDEREADLDERNQTFGGLVHNLGGY